VGHPRGLWYADKANTDADDADDGYKVEKEYSVAANKEFERRRGETTERETMNNERGNPDDTLNAIFFD
jgi:hypothetical protein